MNETVLCAVNSVCTCFAVGSCEWRRSAISRSSQWSKPASWRRARTRTAPPAMTWEGRAGSGEVSERWGRELRERAARAVDRVVHREQAMQAGARDLPGRLRGATTRAAATYQGSVAAHDICGGA